MLGDAQSEELVLPSVEVKNFRDPEWISYRNFYKAMEVFEDYSGPKNLLDPKVKLSTKNETETFQNLRLKLQSENYSKDISLNYGWGTIPFSLIAYNEEAEFLLNRPARTFEFRRVITIAKKEDGMYLVKDLREACKQVEDFFKSMSFIYRIQLATKKCKGAKFFFSEKYNSDTDNIEYVSASKEPISLTEVKQSERVASYLFKDEDAKATVIVRGPLLAIRPIID